MRHAISICVMAWVVAGVTTGRNQADAASVVYQEAQPPAAFTRVCIRCHATERVVSGRRFRAQWEELIEQMVARGATGSDEDFATVTEYLVSEYGRVNINTAASEDLAQVLHLDTKDADAIVAYRKAHGRFADFDALIAVPGAPVEALKKRRDAIVF